MISIRKPPLEKIQNFLTRQRGQPFSYEPVGATREAPPAGYKQLHVRARLGDGESTFEVACSNLRQWVMMEVGYVEIHPRDSAPSPGLDVAVLVRGGGVWWLNACRVVYVIDESLPVRRFGMAYGTLDEHTERGEERFLVEKLEDGSVWYEIFSFSRLRHWLAWLGYPLARRLQKRFANDSLSAMARSISPAEGK